MSLFDWRPYLFSGIASVTAECATFPIDTTKTRLQIQGQKQVLLSSHTHIYKYHGVIRTIWTIFRQEGVYALYKGLPAAVFRQSTYGTLKYGLYNGFKQIFQQLTREENTLRRNVLCGVLAGVISSVAANPTDVVKVRMQASHEQFRDLSLWTAFAKIARTEGVHGLWRGVVPTAQRAAVVCGVEFPVYDICKKRLLSSGFMEDSASCHFISSAVAGAAGAVSSNPIEVVRTRLMNQQNLRRTVIGQAEPPMIYSNSWDCLVQTVRHEGVLALWKGTLANWLRLGPWCIIFFITYEKLAKEFAASNAVIETE